MEENKVTKISLSTFFLILAIILIIIMGIFIFKLYDERAELTEESIKQNEKMSDLQNNVDNLTSELNKISTSISKETTTNNTSSNTITTEQKHTNIQQDLSSYLGSWQDPISNGFVYIYSIDNNEIMFDFLDFYIGNNDHIRATLNGNTASFVINDGHDSLNGKITLTNNKIIVNVMDSTFDNVTKGTITFPDYWGLQN